MGTTLGPKYILCSYMDPMGTKERHHCEWPSASTHLGVRVEGSGFSTCRNSTRESPSYW